jgi:N-acetylglutamate synthase-like GNAT family acetyltransferase
MIEIDLLKNHPNAVHTLVKMWYEELGKLWAPDVPIEQSIERFQKHQNDKALPITLIALDGDLAIGMCSLRQNDGTRMQFEPCLGSLVVDPQYRGHGIGKILVEAIKQKAKQFGFDRLYLYTVDPTIHEYYIRLGWKKVGVDDFKGHPMLIMKTMLE